MEAVLSGKPIAVLIDAENVLQPDLVSGLLSRLTAHGRVGLMRAYGNMGAIEKWKSVSIEFGIQPMLQFNPTDKGNASDFALTIDAMDLLHSDRFGAFCIVSSDSDFVPLVTRLRAEGLPVYGCGEAKKTVETRKSYDDFFEVETLLKSAKSPPKKNAPEKKKAADSGRIEPSNAVLDHVAKVVATAGGKKAKITLTGLGQRLKKDFPEFRIKDYHYASLGKFLAAFPGRFEFSTKDGKSYVKLP